jgi:SAM-dependent methyltransferase
MLPNGIQEPARRLWFALRGHLPHSLLARHYPGVEGRIHVADMLHGDSAEAVAQYTEAGQSAVRIIERALQAAGRNFHEVQSCLDIPSGYGRVLRWLVREIPPARITACDIDANAVRFCAAEFGARPAVASAEPGELKLEGPFDLVWVGSLLTHLAPEPCFHLLRVLADLMSPGGVLIFTTHGEDSLYMLPAYGVEFSDLQLQFESELQTHGVAFAPYQGARDYGITVHHRLTLAAITDQQFGSSLRLLERWDRGWVQHQDVWVYERL